MTVNDLLDLASDLKKSIRKVQNDNTGPAARDLRDALASAFEEMTSVISQLNLALEQEEALNEEDELSYEDEHCSGRQDSFGYCEG